MSVSFSRPVSTPQFEGRHTPKRTLQKALRDLEAAGFENRKDNGQYISTYIRDKRTIATVHITIPSKGKSFILQNESYQVTEAIKKRDKAPSSQ